MATPDALFAALHAMGAGEFAHLNGPLADHLHGTAALLREWGNREALCAAGLYHAVYGTDGYTPALTDLAGRARIAALIGDEAEALAYLYGACARSRYYPRIGSAAQSLFADRYTDTEYVISDSLVHDLCELILANELEIAQGNAAFRAQHGAALAGLFERMAGVVSAGGFAAYRRILSDTSRR